MASFPPFGPPMLSLILVVLLAVGPASPSFLSCENWFERDVLCNSIDVRKEWSMKFQEKDLTHCPDRCQTCRNYDMLESNITSSDNRSGTGSSSSSSNNNNTCIPGYDGYCYNNEDEYHHHQQQIYYDEYGNPLTTMPWQMQYFYEYVHCARDFKKIQNIWKTGDSNAMYELIVRDFPQYSPTVLSRPADSAYASQAKDEDTDVGVGPWLVQLENFLTDEECDEMIRQTKIAIADTSSGYSVEAKGDGPPNETGGVCQSTQAWCHPEYCMQEPALKRSWKKIEELVGLPFDTHTEPIHFIQYVPGQHYGSHTDAIADEYNSVTGPRLFTLLFYLNDVEEGNGGETCFPQIKRANGIPAEPICIRPKKGRAVIWPNILNELPNGTVELAENRTWHEANAITEGYKFASTVWYHLRNFSYAEEIDCQDIYTGIDSGYYEDFDEYGYPDDDAYDGNFYHDGNNYEDVMDDDAYSGNYYDNGSGNGYYSGNYGNGGDDDMYNGYDYGTHDDVYMGEDFGNGDDDDIYDDYNHDSNDGVYAGNDNNASEENELTYSDFEIGYDGKIEYDDSRYRMVANANYFKKLDNFHDDEDDDLPMAS